MYAPVKLVFKYVVEKASVKYDRCSDQMHKYAILNLIKYK